MKAYDSLAPYYDEFMDFMAYDDEAKALHYLIEDLQAERILDLGAGSGGHLLPLLRNGHKVDALDISGPMLEVLAGKLRYQGLKARLYQGDMCTYAKAGSYDFIYALGDTVHHLDGLEAFQGFLKQSYANLASGGHLVFTHRSPDYFEFLADIGNFYEVHGADYLLWAVSLTDSAMAVMEYTAFIKAQDQRFDKIEETHKLAIYTEDDITRAITASGLQVCPELFANYLASEDDAEEYKCITVLQRP